MNIELKILEKTKSDMKIYQEELNQVNSLLPIVKKKLIKYSIVKCEEEYKLLIEHYKVKLEQELELEVIKEDKQNKIYNDFNKCLDQHSGINRKVILYDGFMRKSKNEYEVCNKKCNDNIDVDEKITNSQNDYVECVSKCRNTHFIDMFNLNSSFKNQLIDLNSKL